MLSVLATTVTFPESTFVPLAVGFFGLGTGYLIYGAEELLKIPPRSRQVDLTTGIWGIWMPGFMQFLTGVYLWVGLVWFHSLREKPLYMTALAFTAYGVHWFAIGMARAMGGDPRPNAFMGVAFTVISVLGLVVFFKAGDWPVGLLFVGLTCVYVSDFFATLLMRVVDGRLEPTARSEVAERTLGLVRLITGGWLMYLTFAATLNATSGTHLWL
jgi:hypothetical protein